MYICIYYTLPHFSSRFKLLSPKYFCFNDAPDLSLVYKLESVETLIKAKCSIWFWRQTEILALILTAESMTAKMFDLSLAKSGQWRKRCMDVSKSPSSTQLWQFASDKAPMLQQELKETIYLRYLALSRLLWVCGSVDLMGSTLVQKDLTVAQKLDSGQLERRRSTNI